MAETTIELRDRVRELRRVPASELRAHPENWRTHPPGQIRALRSVLEQVGFAGAALAYEDAEGALVLIDGHARQEIAGDGDVPVLVLDVDAAEARLLLATFDPLASMAGTDGPHLAELLASVSIDNDELAAHMASYQPRAPQPGAPDADVVPDPPQDPISRPGDLWLMGDHRLMCGDCRAADDVARLVDEASIDLAFTSPPYAAQREYDVTSGFVPVPPGQYVDWFAPAAALVGEHLGPRGSWCVNINPHADGGQRVLYVMDLVIAHAREWGWRFIDEFSWVDTKGGVPGAWPNRFKDGWEPVFHFSRQAKIKFRPLANGHESSAMFDYSPDTAKAGTGSGLLGEKATDVREGIARPSNVLHVASSSDAGHPAAFPVALPEFFVRAYTDPGDIVYDPFAGSGSTLIAADRLERRGLAMEISPSYCDVIVARWEAQSDEKAVRLDG